MIFDAKEPLWALEQGIDLVKVIFKEFFLETMMNGCRRDTRERKMSLEAN